MSKLNNRKTMPRYMVIVIVMIVIGLCIVSKTVYTMTVKRDYWMKVASRLSVDSLPDPAQRGNILSCDGQLMASTLPEYRLYMDFKAGGARKDAMLEQTIDTLCDELHRIFPEQTAEQFRARIEEGRDKASQHWALWPKRVDYNTLQELQKLPLLRLTPLQGGFCIEDNSARKHPFERLALRTLGNMFAEKDSATSGLELAYDSILRGEPGWRRQMKVLNQKLNISEKAPVAGADIVTTIDVGIQDIAERCLREELEFLNKDGLSAYAGVAMVMEVETGDIKAIVNLDALEGGGYAELVPHAISDLLEPGSVFKTASLLVAIDDAKIDTNYVVNCAGGVKNMHGRDMKDWNWRKGGYGALKVPKILGYSSNIGISSIIDTYYSKDPERFVQGIYRTGLADDLKLRLPGYHPAIIRGPSAKPNWSKTDLPWMSIGYVTQVPPISVLTFYNTIANGGKMMRPRLVKEVRREGELVEMFEPEVMREQIAKKSTIATVQSLLEKVVTEGLGKSIGSKHFKIAGKTGTAQIARGGGYHGGVMHYLLSFCGYFPADRPKYSCIVCIQKRNSGSGGGMSGKVFHNIAESMMAQGLNRDMKKAVDKDRHPSPEVKKGDLRSVDIVLNKLGYATDKTWMKSNRTSEPAIGTATVGSGKANLAKTARYASGIMPDVVGMGARDAVYLLERQGLKVRLEGRGKVSGQSLAAGHKIRKGEACTLQLN